MNIFENPSQPDGTPLLMAVRVVKRFLSPWQYTSMTEGNQRTVGNQTGHNAEDVAYYVAQFKAMNATIQAMPTTYQQAHLGDDAIAHLHYFLGHSHWWVTEKDRMGGVHRASGLTFLDGDVGYGHEGYISIAEIIEQGAMLDFRFTPKPLRAIKPTLDALRRDEGSMWPKPGESGEALFARLFHRASAPFVASLGVSLNTEVHHV
jgi:hypothetical protein